MNFIKSARVCLTIIVPATQTPPLVLSWSYVVIFLLDTTLRQSANITNKLSFLDALPVTLLQMTLFNLHTNTTQQMNLSMILFTLVWNKNNRWKILHQYWFWNQNFMYALWSRFLAIWLSNNYLFWIVLICMERNISSLTKM